MVLVSVLFMKFSFWSTEEVKEQKKIYRAMPPANSEFIKDAKEIVTDVRDKVMQYTHESTKVF